MDKESIQKYAPTILLIAAMFYQYNVFVTPQQLEVTHRQVLEEISLKYATKEQNSAMKEQLSDMQKKVDKIYEVIINERTKYDFNRN
ncbi:MAG: hypothetical protein ACI4S3_07250 [Candidatus Gastranaerophilaceae bacterium]